MEIKIPELSLVVLIGTSGSGKSTFAKKFFDKYETISSDICRGIVSNDENDQSATDDAFDLLYYMVSQRLKRGLLTVVDATNVQKNARKGLIEVARKYHALPVAIVMDIPEKVSQNRNKQRNNRNFGKHVISRQYQQLKKSLRTLKKEGFRTVHILKEEDINNLTKINREKLYSNKKEIAGPFDIIGDIHGCFDELTELLAELNYKVDAENLTAVSPDGRKVIFLGDLVDRGPDSVRVLKLVMNMVESGNAYCVPGNHDIKLQKKLNKKHVNTKFGLLETLKQLEHESQDFIFKLKNFLYSLTSHFVFDDGKLVVSHAGIKEEMQGRGSGVVRAFCLYGDTTGETDEFGLPVRYNWALEYRGKAKVVYGHTPVPEPEWLNNTINIDTGCVFGGHLTALRYPENQIVSVKAKKVYSEPVKPIKKDINETVTNNTHDDLLDINDYLKKQVIHTKLRKNILIEEENAISAIETISRFSVNPRWLIYIPPTMSPAKTSKLPDFLEHPLEALDYYKKNGIKEVICEKKHMGSRAVIIICKNNESTLKHFGIRNKIGICYTRTGRNFFINKTLESEFLSKVNMALTKSGFWEKFNTDWVILDSELMPWSVKAQSLLKSQYAAVGVSAKQSILNVTRSLKMASERGISEVDKILDKFNKRSIAIDKYIEAYREYSWNVSGIEDLKLAPFHILATENAVHMNKTHKWHMENISEICKADTKLFLKTEYILLNLENKSDFDKAVKWWLDLTSRGGEGMVVKPINYLSYSPKGLLQPAIKCRGREYLRIIYGAEYNSPENLSRLKERSLSKKRSLALKELALGADSLEKFVNKEPLREIHKSVFATLALESEKTDPRL